MLNRFWEIMCMCVCVCVVCLAVVHLGIMIMVKGNCINERDEMNLKIIIFAMHSVSFASAINLMLLNEKNKNLPELLLLLNLSTLQFLLELTYPDIDFC